MTTTPSSSDGEIIRFLRQRDFRLVRELGQGACGATVLLRDETLDELIVCKKYAPHHDASREQLFSNFVREIKLLYRLHHPNVLRVFHHYLYPDQFAGYILMEFIDGEHINDYVENHPTRINDLFVQTLAGFEHLENQGILHRDIRPMNLMVTKDGVLKIIDLGFGKQIETSQDFEKSVNLNWWCAPPAEFASELPQFWWARVAG